MGCHHHFSGFEHVLTVDDYLEFRLDRGTIENPGIELKHVDDEFGGYATQWGDYLHPFSLGSPLQSHQKWWVWQSPTRNRSRKQSQMGILCNITV